MTTKDLHMHTVFCDGTNAPEQMVLSAIDKGLTTVGVCAHSFTFFDTSYCIQKEAVPRYLAEVRYLRAKYFDRIRVLCGVEQDYYSDQPTDDFDYVIGSVHYLKCGEDYVPVDETPEILKNAAEKYFDGDIYALCEEYYRTVADVVNKTACDIIGHFDLITKFIEREPLFDTHHPRYIAAWKSAADKLLKTGVPFEINTGAMSRGYRTSPYPSAEIIDYLKANGGELVQSSDAHSAAAIAYRFEEYSGFLSSNSHCEAL